MLSASKSGSAASTGYNLTRSLRTRASASAYLNRTPASAPTAGTKFTFSAWMKLGANSINSANGGALIESSIDGARFSFIGLSSGQLLFYFSYQNPGVNPPTRLITNQVFRDPSSWYHVVCVADTTQVTASNRLSLYINGVQVTSFSTTNYPAQNATTYLGAQSVAEYIGLGYNCGLSYFDGYMAETYFIDGQALTPSSFGSTNALTGVWQPAKYTGTYGTNGFYLPFTDNSALTTSSNVGLGKDFSGNGNYWTTNNISITAGVTYDSMTDVPTLTSATAANFPTLNPLYISNVKAAPTLANANLTINPAYDRFMNATISLPVTGKFYWEATVTAATTGGNQTGLGINTNQGDNRAQYGFVSTLNDVWGVAVDMGALSITWYKNNVSQSSSTVTPNLEYFPFFYTDTNSSPTQQWAINFGQRPFSYTPPTGFVALNTFNLPTSTILAGNKVMDATLWTGDGAASHVITNAAAFKPDLVWIKARGQTFSNILTDSVRGATKIIESDQTAAEATQIDSLLSFNSSGFTVGTFASMNNNTYPYVGWQWQAGQGSTSSNTNGSITSTVSVNASAGFSVVTYTGTGANATVGHGLGVAPAFMIFKRRDSTSNWPSYHSSLGNTGGVYLNGTGAFAVSSAFWNNTSPTSSVFTLGGGNEVNTASATNVAYCWTPIAGYSAFGSYSGNNSTDGPMVYTGFQPKFVLIKGTGAASGWQLQDSARNTYNVVNAVLRPDLSAAESTGYGGVIDFLSNGFKVRTSDTNYNSSSYGPYIYMAFATNPFKQSLAF